MTYTPDPPTGFNRYEGGKLVCILCRLYDGEHQPTCPLVELDTQVRELTAHTGMFIASVQETLEKIGRILRS